MAVATSDFLSSDHINQERHPLLKNLSQKFKMLLFQQTPPVSLNTCFLGLNAMCPLMVLGKEGSPRPVSLIRSRTIPACGGGYPLGTVGGSAVLKGMGWQLHTEVQLWRESRGERKEGLGGALGNKNSEGSEGNQEPGRG